MSRGVLLLVALFVSVAHADYDNAEKGYQISFPRDHGSHPEMRIEWWYYTGNLRSESQEFGYQLTFFRVAEESPIRDSPWSFDHLYFAHFAVSDVNREQYFFRERFGRDQRSGAKEGDLYTWIGPWSVKRDGSEHILEAETKDFALSLRARESDLMLHGDEGYSAKSNTPGNASHYYSYPRMPTSGTVRIGSQSFEVSGFSWMDHEFGSSFLDKGQIGWDWFSLRLDDGSNLMLFRIRNSEGSSFYKGTYHKDGKSQALEGQDFILEEKAYYTSEKSGARYPTEWVVKVTSKGIELEVKARFQDQEPQGFSSIGIANPVYWEGSVSATGSHRGEGYLEMTGYSGSSMDRYLSQE